MADWKDNLGSFFDQREKAKQVELATEMTRFLSGVVVPAFEEVAIELRAHGRGATIRESENTAAIVVEHAGEEELLYSVCGRMFPNGVRPYAQVRYRQRGGLRRVTVESMLRAGAGDHTLNDITKDEVMSHLVKSYMQHVGK